MGQSKYYTDEEVRKAINKLLEKNQRVESNLGLDSTISERTKARAKKNGYMMKIKDLDPEYYETIEPDRNETEADKKLKEKP